MTIFFEKLFEKSFSSSSKTFRQFIFVPCAPFLFYGQFRRANRAPTPSLPLFCFLGAPTKQIQPTKPPYGYVSTFDRSDGGGQGGGRVRSAPAHVCKGGGALPPPCGVLWFLSVDTDRKGHPTQRNINIANRRNKKQNKSPQF